MADIFGYLGGMGSGFLMGAYIAMWIIPIAVIIIAVIVAIRNKIIFCYPVRIYRVRENCKLIEINKKGGYISRKGSAPFFRIKVGNWYWGWWKKVDLTTTPDPKYIDEQNRVYYLQIDVATFVQLRRRIDLHEEVIEDEDGKRRTVLVGNNLELTPVESDVKYGAILSINRIRDVTRQGERWKTILAWSALFFVGIILLIGYLVLLKTKCP